MAERSETERVEVAADLIGMIRRFSKREAAAGRVRGRVAVLRLSRQTYGRYVEAGVDVEQIASSAARSVGWAAGRIEIFEDVSDVEAEFYGKG